MTNEAEEDNPSMNEIDSLNEKILRMAAETENIRKRYEKQIEETKLFAITNFAKDLLSVSDNLTRALLHKPENMSEEMQNLINGIEMTQKELLNVFNKYKIQIIEPAVGDKFDYNLHYAVAQTENSDYPEGTILQLMQAGYNLESRLLRPAVVTVTKSSE